MYSLTDYNLSALRIIQAAISDGIDNAECEIRIAKRYYPESMHEDLTMPNHRAIAVLREHNVHLLTAISIVKDRETVASN